MNKHTIAIRRGVGDEYFIYLYTGDTTWTTIRWAESTFRLCRGNFKEEMSDYCHPVDVLTICLKWVGHIVGD